MNTAEAMIPNLGTPGGATWSIMGAGLGITGFETHGGALTTSMASLTAFDEVALIGMAIDTWAAVSGFSNLGMVADFGAAGGALESLGGHLGDMRFGAIFIDGPSSVLAHAYEPGTEAIFGPGGTIAGDTHFDKDEFWGDGTLGSIDFYTVALHEIGHALGLDHSADPTSVMFPFYSGVKHTLSADDIAGITTIYGPAAPVPEPVTMVLAGAALLAGIRRKRMSA